jgi:hypothetical protein
VVGNPIQFQQNIPSISHEFPEKSRRTQASPDGAEGVVDDDWRRFRARLLQREDALTEDVAKGTMEKELMWEGCKLGPPNG